MNVLPLPGPHALINSALAAAEVADRSVSRREADQRADDLRRVWRLMTAKEQAVAIILAERHGFDRMAAAQRVLRSRPARPV